VGTARCSNWRNRRSGGPWMIVGTMAQGAPFVEALKAARLSLCDRTVPATRGRAGGPHGSAAACWAHRSVVAWTHPLGGVRRASPVRPFAVGLARWAVSAAADSQVSTGARLTPALTVGIRWENDTFADQTILHQRSLWLAHAARASDLIMDCCVVRGRGQSRACEPCSPRYESNYSDPRTGCAGC
jgi:hypothetical protein